MRNICMIVSYDGTTYHGFQTQPSKNTIQDILERAIRSLTGETITITSSGRTDAGVHARCQVINFFTSSPIPIVRWCLALNTLLPADIIVSNAKQVADHFHSRRSADRKTYRYTIRCGKHPDLFRRNQEYFHPVRLNTEAMQSSLSCLLGEHDFTSFCSIRSTKKSNVRFIHTITLESEPLDPILQSYCIHICVTGNGFLYNMVRIIVGTLIQIGEGKRSADAMIKILASRDRAQAGPTAMPQGLILWEVLYNNTDIDA